MLFKQQTHPKSRLFDQALLQKARSSFLFAPVSPSHRHTHVPYQPRPAAQMDDTGDGGCDKSAGAGGDAGRSETSGIPGASCESRSTGLCVGGHGGRSRSSFPPPPGRPGGESAAIIRRWLGCSCWGRVWTDDWTARGFSCAWIVGGKRTFCCHYPSSHLYPTRVILLLSLPNSQKMDYLLCASLFSARLGAVFLHRFAT